MSKRIIIVNAEYMKGNIFIKKEILLYDNPNEIF